MASVPTCVVCEEEYGEVFLPKSLECGHNCSNCVDQLLIAGDPMCPECRRPIRATSPDDLVVNIALLRVVIEKEATKEKEAARDTKPFTANKEVPRRPAKLNAGRCVDHDSLMVFYCEKCKVNVCRDCIVNYHNVPPSGHCKIIST